jgi:dipicolinate synthase subunit A
MTVNTYEKSGRGERCSSLLKDYDGARGFSSITVLPIPTTRDGRTLNGTEIPLSALPPLTGDGSLVVGYGVPEGLREELCDEGATVLDAMEDEEFLCDNGYLTALATLGIVITTCDKALDDIGFGIVGYGRIGKRLTEMLLFLGAKVRVYSSRSDTRMALSESGVFSSESCEGAELNDVDILINTAPAVIFDTSREAGFPENIRVIDLASGDNFPGFEGVERYPSVPAKMFPISAGNIWFKSVKRQLMAIEKSKNGGTGRG